MGSKQEDKQTIRTRLNKWFLWLLVMLTGLTGCREEFSQVPLAPLRSMETAAVPDRAQPEMPPIPTEDIVVQAGRQDESSGVVPAAYRLLPVSNRDIVFDTLLGSQQDAYFLQDRNGETFVVFDREGLPVRMVQARRLGNEKGSILILLGMSVWPNEVSIEKVYTFEKGSTALVKPYQAGKDRFLTQFRNHGVFDKSSKIQGITGATPIWKPVADQIEDIRETLLKEKADSEWIAAVKNKGYFWQRSERKVVDLTNEDSESTVQEPSVLEPETPEIPFVQDSNLPNLLGGGPIQAEEEMQETTLEVFAEFPEGDLFVENTPNTILYEHWKLVAVAEVSLLACGLLIVTTTQIKRAVYK